MKGKIYQQIEAQGRTKEWVCNQLDVSVATLWRWNKYGSTPKIALEAISNLLDVDIEDLK